MRIFIITFVVSIFSSSVSAQNSWTNFDWRSGNSYSNYADRSGVTTYGNNIQNGSNWRLRQNFDGSYNGTDADGNYFFGNNNTGYYSNLGTGETCIGTGYARTCY